MVVAYHTHQQDTSRLFEERETVVTTAAERAYGVPVVGIAFHTEHPVIGCFRVEDDRVERWNIGDLSLR